MLENDYPMPSYIAETFEKTEGWVETPKPSEESLAHKSPRVFAIDCEMVRILFSTCCLHAELLASAKRRMAKNWLEFV